MNYISNERAKEILKEYKENKKTDLFNWCEEYKQFIDSCVCSNVGQMVEYCLKKSYEDGGSPINYEDIDLFDYDKAIDRAVYEYDTNEEEFKEYANDEDTFNRKVKNVGDFEVFLKSLSKDELKDFCNEFNIDETDAEIYEYWIITEPLLYYLDKQNEIIIDGNIWGRQSTGQSISLDYCCIKAFISLLEDRLN